MKFVFNEVLILVVLGTLFINADVNASGRNYVNKQLEKGAMKLKMEMHSLITKNLGYKHLQVNDFCITLYNKV